MKFSIIGSNGRMGRLFSEILSEFEVVGIEKDEPLSKGRGSDITIIAVPIDEAPGTIKRVSEELPDCKLVIDLSSVMKDSIEAMQELNCECACVHPLFGPDTIRLKSQNFIIVPVKKGEALEWFIGYLKGRQAHVKLTTLREHERILSNTQALIHLTNFALAGTINDGKLTDEEKKDFSTTMFRINNSIFERLFSQSEDMVWEIISKNDFSVLKKLKDNVERLIDEIARGDKAGFKREFNEIKNEIESLSEREKLFTKRFRTRDKDSLALLGPRGSFTDSACKGINYRLKKEYYDTIIDVIRAVKEKKAKIGLIPIENSIQGTVNEALDYINQSGLFIKASVILRISHCCAVHPENTHIETVLSHPHALNQCRRYIEKHFPNARMLTTKSTSEAFQQIKVGRMLNSVAIGPEIAARIYGLRILEKDIEDEKNNKTRFFVISRDEPKDEGKTVSIAIIPSHERQGVLYSILEKIDKQKINLTKIESRPIKDELGRYIFYIDLDGNLGERRVIDALEDIRSIADVRILGCYETWQE